jgi:hypothetical protein
MESWRWVTGRDLAFVWRRLQAVGRVRTRAEGCRGRDPGGARAPASVRQSANQQPQHEQQPVEVRNQLCVARRLLAPDRCPPSSSSPYSQSLSASTSRRDAIWKSFGISLPKKSFAPLATYALVHANAAPSQEKRCSPVRNAFARPPPIDGRATSGVREDRLGFMPNGRASAFSRLVAAVRSRRRR